MKIAIILLFLVAGLALLLGAVFKWGWMLRSRRSRLLVERYGIEQGRIFYGVFGVILIVIALIVMLVPEVGQTLAGKPDAMAILKVEADGCTVTRSEVVGADADESLMWKVMDQNFQTVFTRSSDEEMSLKYHTSGVYDVILQSWHHGSYVTISNKVEINCTN